MNKPFTVLTISKRTGWEQLANESVRKQTLQPKEWLLVTSVDTSIAKCDAMAIPEPPKKRISNLNASLNQGLRFIKTPYVIFYQDFIDLPANCFEKLMKLVDEKTFVSSCTPNYDGSNDYRFTGLKKPRECRPMEWEANVAAAPMAIIKKLGGFDEQYDWGWSWDNVNLAERAAMLGCKFIVDESNRPKLLPHEKNDEKTMTLNVNRHRQTMLDIRVGIRPLKNDYL